MKSWRMRVLVAVLAVVFAGALIISRREPGSIASVPASAAAPVEMAVVAQGTAVPSGEPSVPVAPEGQIGYPESAPMDLFAVRTWRPAPSGPPAVPAIPAPDMRVRAPTAPPLPFRFLARIVDTETERATFAFARDRSVILAREGDVIDGDYVLEAVEHGRLVFVHRPTDTRQSISLGSTQ